MLTNLLRTAILLYGGYKFTIAEKEDRTPTWYGIWVLIAMISIKLY